MSDDPESVAEVQPENISQEPAPATEGEGQQQQEAPPQPQEAKPEPQVDWRDKRIATLTRRLRELQERNAVPPEQPPPSAEQLSQQQIEQRARELSAIQDFNRRCDEAALAGRAAFGEMEFNGRIANLQKLVDNSDPTSVQAYNSLLMAAIDTGEGPRVLHALGADLNEAQRILGLQPTRMVVELMKRAASPEPQLSLAPKPIQPIGVRGATHERISPDDPDRSDHLSTSEWMRRREAQLSERRGR